MSNHTWKLVDMPPNSKPIYYKWLFQRNYYADGTLHTYKARLVANCFQQKKEIDFSNTYAPIARISLIRVIVPLASIYDLHVYQMDVKISFLNGYLEK